MKWTNLIKWSNGEIGTENEPIGEGSTPSGLWLRSSPNTDETVTPVCPRCEAPFRLVPSDGVGGFSVTCECEEPPNVEIPVDDD